MVRWLPMVAALMGGTHAAAATRPIVLERSGPWHLDYATQHCVLTANFKLPEGNTGTADLSFSKTAPGDAFRLIFVHPALRTTDTSVQATVRFGDPGTPTPENLAVGTVGGAPAMFLQGARLGLPAPVSTTLKHIADVTPAIEAATTYVLLTVNGKTLRYETKPLDKPLAALRKCTDNLVQSWGFAPEAVASWQTGPLPTVSPANWLTDDDYPANMLRKGANGLLEFRLDVDATGRATKCVVLVQTNPLGFGEAACGALAKRARFTPAIDAKGRAVPSFYVNSVRYMM